MPLAAAAQALNPAAEACGTSHTRHSLSIYHHPPRPALTDYYGRGDQPVEHVPMVPVRAQATSLPQLTQQSPQISGSHAGDGRSRGGGEEELDYVDEVVEGWGVGAGLPLSAAMRDKWMR
jgi:hypothetical protein